MSEPLICRAVRLDALMLLLAKTRDEYGLYRDAQRRTGSLPSPARTPLSEPARQLLVEMMDQVANDRDDPKFERSAPDYETFGRCYCTFMDSCSIEELEIEQDIHLTVGSRVAAYRESHGEMPTLEALGGFLREAIDSHQETH